MGFQSLVSFYSFIFFRRFSDGFSTLDLKIYWDKLNLLNDGLIFWEHYIYLPKRERVFECNLLLMRLLIVFCVRDDALGKSFWRIPLQNISY